MGALAGGDALGASPQQPYRPETTAADELAKTLLLKITKDTIDIPFFLMTSDVRQYRSSPNRPVLAPVGAERMASTVAMSEESWKATYNQLVAQLPEDFKSLFTLAMQQPLRMRSENFVLFDTFLQNSAKTLLLLEEAAAPLPSDSIAELHALTNLAIPYLAVNSLIPQSAVLLSSARDFLSTVGPNYPHFDTQARRLEGYNQLIADLQTAVAMEQSDPSSLEGKALLNSTIQGLRDLAHEIDRYAAGNDLSILRHSVHVALLSGEALTFSNTPGAGAMLLSLSSALVAAGDEHSNLSLMGSELSAFQKAIATALSGALDSSAPLGSSSLLDKMATLLLLGAIAMATASTDSASAADTPNRRSASDFNYNLQLTALNQSGMLAAVTAAIAERFTDGDDSRAAIAEILKLSIMMTLILAHLASGDLEHSIPLLQSQGAVLKESIDAIAQQFDGSSDETSLQMGIHFQQASIALDRGDYEQFLTTLEETFEIIGSPTAGLMKDIGEGKVQAEAMAEQLDTNLNNITEINMQG